MINLDKYNLKYLVPIYPILFDKIFFKFKYKYYNFINLDKPNPKYLVPIFPILFVKIFFNKIKYIGAKYLGLCLSKLIKLFNLLFHYKIFYLNKIGDIGTKYLVLGLSKLIKL